MQVHLREIIPGDLNALKLCRWHITKKTDVQRLIMHDTYTRTQVHNYFLKERRASRHIYLLTSFCILRYEIDIVEFERFARRHL